MKKKIVTNCYESFTDSRNQFTDGYVLLRAVYDHLRIVTSYLQESKSVDNREKIFDVKKFASLFTDTYECLWVVTNCYELFTDTSELFTDACDWLRVGDPLGFVRRIRVCEGGITKFRGWGKSMLPVWSYLVWERGLYRLACDDHRGGTLRAVFLVPWGPADTVRRTVLAYQ